MSDLRKDSDLGFGDGRAPEAAGASSPLDSNPAMIVHRLLRGRYHIAALLGVIFAAVGAPAGYLAVKPSYTSLGMIQIVPATRKILYETEESQIPPMFDSFVSAQAQFVTARRVFDMAMQDEQLRQSGWPDGVDGLRMLQQSVAAWAPPRGQIVTVRSEAGQPHLAQESLNAVLRAYKRLYIDERGRTRMERQRILEEQQLTLRAEVRALKDQINSLAEQFGVDNLARLHAARVDELSELDARLREVDLAIADAETRAAARPQSGAPTASAEPGSEGVPDPIAERRALEAAIAERDRPLADMLARERALRTELANLRNAGYGPQHRGVRQVDTQLTTLRIQIEDRVDALADGFTPEAGGETLIAGASLEDLRALRVRYQRLRDDAEAQVSFLGARRRVIAGLQEEVVNKERLLADARNALDRLQLEARQQDESTDRVTIASWGDYPVAPSRDKRITLAGAGFVGGFGFGVGLVGLFGLVRPSCRYVDDLERPTHSAPLLGTLPDLNTHDPEQEELAALSVHQIRNVLEIQNPSPDGLGRVFTITSACAGEGKTSLTMALGMSFAAAGQRTLIVDSDLVGRGVTLQLRLDKKPGLRELLEGATAEDVSHSTPVVNLRATPTGSAERFEPKNISRDGAARALGALRGSFDIVLIDTGPIMGSLEGNLLCALSDATLLVVTRGQKSRLVQAALARLANIGGRCAGTVFNRALADDYMRSVSHTSFHVGSVRSGQQPITRDPSIAGSRALVQAVAGTGHEREGQDAA